MANLKPEELKRIAPDEYARIYGDDKPEKPDDEADRLNAETRLLRARRLNAREKELQQPKEKPTRSPAPSGAWWIALAVAIAQFIFAWYIIAKY